MPKRKSAEKFEMKNLIVLTYGQNDAYMTVIEAEKAMVKDKNLHISPEAGTWYYDHFIKAGIGGGYQAGDHHSPPILGVYDRTKLEHLQSLVHDASAAIHSGYPSHDD